METPHIRLEDLSAEEQQVVLNYLRRKLIFRAVLLGILAAGCVGVLVYFNSPAGKGMFTDNLETLNVVFVFLAVIVARFLYSELRDYSAEKKSGKKKVIRSKITGTSAGEIRIGNRKFEEGDFLFELKGFDDLKSGDPVIVELSARSELLFSIRKTE